MDSEPAFSAVLFVKPNLESETLPQLIGNEMPRLSKIIKQTQKDNVERAYNEVGEGLVE